MIEILIECLELYQEVKVIFRRTRQGLLVTIFSIDDCKAEIFKEGDSKEYIQLTLFDMLDSLGYTPKSIKAVRDIIYKPR